IYHGHVRTWDELTQEMKNVLINNGLSNKKGKIK
ncbi:adhesin, partial [Moraxella catarrhalis]